MRTEQAKGVAILGGRPQQAKTRAPIRPLARILNFARRKPLGAIGGAIVLVMIFTAIFAELQK